MSAKGAGLPRIDASNVAAALAISNASDAPSTNANARPGMAVIMVARLIAPAPATARTVSLPAKSRSSTLPR